MRTSELVGTRQVPHKSLKEALDKPFATYMATVMDSGPNGNETQTRRGQVLENRLDFPSETNTIDEDLGTGRYPADTS